MANIKYLVDLDLNQNQLTNAVVQNLATAPSNPKDGQVYWDTSLDALRVYSVDISDWITLGDGVTNLSYTPSDSQGVVESDTGANATIPLATTVGGTNKAGLMSPSDKTKIDGIETNADVTDSTNVNAAGAVMESDISSSPSGRVIDDESMLTASATTLATSLSIKTYVDNSVAGGVTYEGGYNASTNTPDLDTNPSSVTKGSMYTVTTAGTFFSVFLHVGDVLIAEKDNPSTEDDWTIVNKDVAEIVSASETSEGIAEIATQLETDTGVDDSRIVTPKKLKSTLGTTGTLSLTLSYNELISSTSTSVVITHNIGKKHVQVQLFEELTNKLVMCKVELTSTNTTTLKFNTAPTANQYRVIIIG